MSKITTIALVVVAMSLAVMAALYMARKKYNKMANINCTLPAGLETYLTKETGTEFPGDFGGGNHTIKDTRAAEDQWITAACMQEFNFRNEHHHLLASLGNDSGYLGDGGVESGINYSNDTKKRPLECNLEASGKNSSQDNYVEKYEQAISKAFPNIDLSSADSLVGSTEESDCPNNDMEGSPLTLFPNSNGYIKQSTLQPWQTFNDQYESNTELSSVPANANSYSTIQNLNSNLLKPNTLSDFAANNNGYVLQQDLQNLLKKTVDIGNSEQNHTKENTSQINSNGYTTLENLSKLNLNTSLVSKNEGHQQLEQAVGVSEDNNGSDVVKTGNISGYVTQHDLNLFAQFQHNN